MTFKGNQSQYYTFLYYVSPQTIFVQYCTDAYDFIDSLLRKLSTLEILPNVVLSVVSIVLCKTIKLKCLRHVWKMHQTATCKFTITVMEHCIHTRRSFGRFLDEDSQVHVQVTLTGAHACQRSNSSTK